MAKYDVTVDTRDMANKIAKKMNERAARALEVFGPEQAFKDEYLTRPIPYDWAQTLRNIIAQNPGYDY